MKTLKGSEKQVKWAEDIRKDLMEAIEKARPLQNWIDKLEELKTAGNTEKYDWLKNELQNAIDKFKNHIENQDSAKYFIDRASIVKKLKNSELAIAYQRSKIHILDAIASNPRGDWDNSRSIIAYENAYTIF